ncbi:MAG: N-acetyltransferase family protein [Actinomycetes bacterium]
MDLQIEHRPALDDALRRELVRIWVDATNAGGALGLVAPTDDAAAQVLARPTWARVEAGTDDLVVGRLAGRVVGWYVLEARSGPLSPHWRTLKRLQVHPDLQGSGYGSALLVSADDVGTRLGLRALHLTVRGGTGTEAFYLRHGYREVGRLPGALRLSEDDLRDELHLWRDLKGTPGRPPS